MKAKKLIVLALLAILLLSTLACCGEKKRAHPHQRLRQDTFFKQPPLLIDLHC
ncbi:MAG: hypothetical protein KAX23_00755 [Dehalococcoidia bacterium]|jgi:hypothetical protein|nr:hypothetical protein [Chloroflexota bacterium]MCK4242056.1 hypothetical protein [Dehalococcoidia bacterium]